MVSSVHLTSNTTRPQSLDLALIQSHRGSRVDLNTTGTTDRYVYGRRDGLNPVQALLKSSQDNPKLAFFIGTQGVSHVLAAKITNALDSNGLNGVSEVFAKTFDLGLKIHNASLKMLLGQKWIPGAFLAEETQESEMTNSGGYGENPSDAAMEDSYR